MLLLVGRDGEIIPDVGKADGTVLGLEIVDSVDDLGHDLSARPRVGRLRIGGILWEILAFALEICGLGRGSRRTLYRDRDCSSRAFLLGVASGGGRELAVETIEGSLERHAGGCRPDKAATMLLECC